jgi:hypothetical protein
MCPSYNVYVCGVVLLACLLFARLRWCAGVLACFVYLLVLPYLQQAHEREDGDRVAWRNRGHCEGVNYVVDS